jgi:[acyl-carrier-protein] S-malonyltransferase
VAERESALVIAPGRGTYGKAELGYLKRLHADKSELMATVDRIRSERGQPMVSELDGAERYSAATHGKGDVASPLIFTSSFADFLDIDRSRFEITAVTGNSMGWYTTLACAGAVAIDEGFSIIDAMGDNSQAGEPGGQVLLSLVDEQWHEIPGLRGELAAVVDRISARSACELFVSIELGGMVVLAGNEAGLEALLAEAPPTPGRAPMRLVNHGPFHSPLMQGSSARATARLPAGWFHSPKVPMVDGRGHIWRPFASASEALWRYTFVSQILETYDFTRAISVALREYAPDRIILLGPGDTLGGAIAQILIATKWRGIRSKRDFQDIQASKPLLLSMGREEQRALVVAT